MIKIMKKMSRWEASLLLCNALLVLAQVWMDMRIPDYMSTITRLVETEGSDMNEIWVAGFRMLACAIASMFITFGSGFVSSYFAATFSKNLRSKIFDNGLDISLLELFHGIDLHQTLLARKWKRISRSYDSFTID